ncbi:hypothetical protein DPIF89300162_1060003 [Tenacibaculum maritimum]|nr:hypothetical protein DPIF89300162_1060003 [Tenacibaculum maritimum]
MKIKRDLTDSIVKSLIKVAVLLNSLTFSVASGFYPAFLLPIIDIKYFTINKKYSFFIYKLFYVKIISLFL